MRLENQKKASILDLTWAKLFDMVAPSGKQHDVPLPYHRSYVNDEYGDMTRDEIAMARSGASWKDIMYLRAIRNQDKEGFSPYFNPNLNYSKRK